MSPMSKSVHRFSVILACCTLFLIFAGGLVTSTDSGLAVPDWPLSYGRLMPPMVGGVFYEHGHRMVAATVGFLTVLLALLITFKEDRRWVKKMAWTAVGLVILQGVLGGLTVLFRLPKPISIGHACLAQTFFCVVVSLAVWTSSSWRTAVKPREEFRGRVPLHRLAMALFCVSYIQLILGAILRHSGRTLPLHISGALMVLGLTLWLFRTVWREYRAVSWLRRLALSLVSVLIIQITLGIATYFLLIHRFDTIPPPFAAPFVITLHVATGAMFLALSLITALWSYRTRPQNSAPLQTTLSDYFTLTKPGISLTAAVTALAGYLLGSYGDIQPLRLFHTCVGVLLSAAGAGSLNMLIERDVDALMHRTQKRPLPSGRLNPGEVLFLGSFCSVAGVLYLSWTVNLLTALIAGLTVSIYLYLYTPLKKVSALCVSVGAVAGALPPVMGWTAATGRLSIEPLVLFGILFFWQFPHFLSLAWLYKEDYASAGLHMLPNLGQNDGATARSLVINSVALLIVSLLPTALGLTGNIYLVMAFAMGVAMTHLSVKFFSDRSRLQAKRVFLFSLLYVPLLVIFMVLNGKTGVWSS